MKKKEAMSRRDFLKKVAAGSVVLAGAAYPTWIERSWVDITRRTVYLKRLPKAFQGIRIVHFTDVHYGFFYDTEDLLQLVSRIDGLKPDILCFTGDFVEDSCDSIEDCIAPFAGLHAPLGKFSVFGNHDYQDDPERVSRMWERAGFAHLTNGHRLVKRDGEVLAFAGVGGFRYYGNRNWERAIKGIPEGTCTVMLVHEPDLADTTSRYPVDLQLSGHSHGGQVRLPFYGHVVTPQYANKYVAGLYTLQPSGLQVFTSRGIGTTGLPIRLLCRPEIAVITLAAAAQS